MGTKRSKPLHNFTMPAGLRWGHQRLLRCINVNSNGRNSGASDYHCSSENRIEQRRSSRDEEREMGKGLYRRSNKVNCSQTREFDDGRRISNDDGGGSDGIGSIREGLMLDVHPAAGDKFKESNLKERIEEGKVSVPPQLPNHAAESRDGNTYCPWNLRMRRTSCKVSDGGNNYATAVDYGNAIRTDAPRIDSGVPQMRVATTATAQKSNGIGAERPTFSVQLSKREIEADFFAMVGRRPPRRPKKRPRVVQRQLDTLFPGLWLTEVTPDMYKVPEAAP